MNVAVQPLTELWWGGLLSSTTAKILLLFLFKKSLKSYQLLFMKSLSIILFFLGYTVIIMQCSLQIVGVLNTIYHFTYVEYLL